VKALFIVPGPIEWASSRYRAYWPSKYMDAEVVQVGELTEAHTAEYDAFIFIKVGVGIEDVKKAGKPIWYDICDPVHWFSPDDAKKIIELADGIVASNEALADDFVKWSGRIVHTIPDRLELSHYPERKTHDNCGTCKFIWFGAAQNRFALFGGLAVLDRLAANGYNIALTIYDDNPQDHWKYKHEFPVYHGRWHLDQENLVIAGHDIALLPPYPGPWGKVKSHNKDLTAYACGLPSTDGQSYEQVEKLVIDAKHRWELSEKGYKRIQEDYTADKSAKEWEALLWA